MNELDFYKILQLVIVSRKEKLNAGDLSGFFEYNEYFELALSLAYMTLTKDLIIKKDDKNPDYEGRLTSNVDMGHFDYLFTKEFCDNPPRVYESTGTSSRWIVDSIRDSLLHNAYTIDFDAKEFKINNQMKDRELVCDVPFSWFNNYAKHHILESKKVNKLDARGVFVNENTFRMMKHCDNNEDVQDFIDKIVTYEVKIKSTSKIDERKTKRYIEEFNDFRAPNLLVRNNLEHASYSEKWSFLKECLNNNLKEMFPNSEMSIEEINDNNIADKLNKLYNTQDNDIFKLEDYRDQYSVLVNRLTKYYGSSKTSVIDSLETLISTIQIYREELKNDNEYEECKDVLDYILNAKNDGSKTLDFIHNYRKERGLPNTYDTNIVGDHHTIPFNETDRKKVSDFLEKGYGFKPESVQIELSLLKQIDESLYNKYSKKFESSDAISREDIAFYTKRPVKIAEQLRMKTTREQDFLELGLVSALGITTYVMNKERIFDKQGYEEIGGITSYSSGLYKNFSQQYSDLEQRTENLNNKIEKIRNDENISSDKKREKLVRKHQIQLDKTNKQLEELELEKENIITYNGEKYKLASNNDTARIIRNCLSHLNRINYTSYDEGNLILEDETGIIKCNIKDLYGFILNDVFTERMINHFGVEDGVNLDVNKNSRKK